jgi:hypothetical protein
MNKISDDPYSNLVLVDNGSLQPQSPGITQLYIHAYINTTVLKMDVLTEDCDPEGDDVHGKRNMHGTIWQKRTTLSAL